MGCTCSTSPRPPCGWCESGQIVDWDEPLAFADTGERTWVSHGEHVGNGEEVLVCTDNEGRTYAYNLAGEPVARDPHNRLRPIRNWEPGDAAARRRVEQKRASRATLEALPEWGMF